MDYLKLSGKRAIVTGSGRGIGRAIAVALAAYGAKVMVSDINDTNGKNVCSEIKEAGGEAKYCHCDVSDITDIKKMVKYTAETFGGIDILVNNAAIGSVPVNFETISDEVWDRILRVDLTAPFQITKEVFPYMKKQSYGKIINISSGYGVTGGDYCAHYASAKAGLIGLTRSIAKEVAKYKINVNVIAVATTDTPGLRETDYEFVADELKDIPWGRIGMPEDVASCVLYLASDASEYVTGQLLAPNGGRRTPY